MPNDIAAQSEPEPIPDRSWPESKLSPEIRRPVAEDAADIHALIASCPPLDGNSLYANLIQATHFADTCAIARLDDKLVGWISGHSPPGRSETFFLWQVAVHPDARGLKLAQRMLADILGRPSMVGISVMETSITRGNESSWGLFRSLSRWLQAPMREALWFDRNRHFRGRHDSEFLVTIGPFSCPPPGP
jgi:L-2,4-diaminobutyric acid acetyltransferase